MGMVVRTNTMALNAYRQLGMNNNAVTKSLEKLSSGFRINRAGDDAAGLAISEKMKAQIKGLETASANAQDGISLIQTAEGNLNEVHDMLNRMVELATKSANGTYTQTEREALQAEVDQLLEEIDRISQSANFNGAKLLDGSLDASAVAAKTGKLDIPATGDELGVDTILHKTVEDLETGTEFSVDLHEVSFSAKEGEKLSIKVGDTEIVLESLTDANGQNDDGDDEAMTADAIINAIVAGTTDDTFKVSVNGEEWKAQDDAGEDQYIQINEQDFSITNGSNGRLSFQQVAAPTGESDTVDGNMKVTIGTVKTIDGSSVEKDVTGYKSNGFAQGYSLDLNGLSVTEPTTLKLSIAGKILTVDITEEDIANSKGITEGETATGSMGDIIAQKFADAYNNGTKFDDTGNAGEFTANVGTAGDQDVGTLYFTGTDATKPASTDFNNSMTAGATITFSMGEKVSSVGDYNVQTTDVKNVTAGDKPRLASTVVSINEKYVADGNSVMIGNVDYTFTTDEAKKNDANTVYIGDMVGEGKKLDMGKVYERLSDAAADNATWTVSALADRKGITLMEKTDGTGESTGNAVAKSNNKMDLSTVDGIKATLGFKVAAKEADPDRALTLQIGDTADDFNKLSVSIADMSAEGLGLANLSIMTEKDASDAIKNIKDAINDVSTARAGMGALQNRLEHTINNLDVTTENLSAANSRIRDTDMAKEMMNYTKMNVLVQSAQAMLAQANQQPQSVLQLLQ